MRNHLRKIGAAVLALTALLFVAAVTPNSFVTPQTPTLGVQRFVQGTDAAGTYKTVYTGGTNGSKCMSLIASSSDGSLTHLINVQITRSATAYQTVAATLAASAGTANAIPPLNLMNPGIWLGLPYDSDGNPYIYLQASDLLQATFATALTSSTNIYVVAVCADF